MRLFLVFFTFFIYSHLPCYTAQYHLPQVSKSNRDVRVIDCFLFFNELDILEIRLDELYDDVDAFVLVEATRTFQNNPKPLYFSENKERYSKFLDKIIHVVIDQYPEFPEKPNESKYDYFYVEDYQRSQIKMILQQLSLKKKDIVMITDVDEIISRHSIPKIKRLISDKNTDIVFGDFQMFKYFLNRKTHNWSISVATSWNIFDRFLQTSSGFRHSGFDAIKQLFSKNKKRNLHRSWTYGVIPNIGWHFTSISGNFASYAYKLQSYAHVSKPDWNQDQFQTWLDFVQSLDCCAVDDSFPKYVQEHYQELWDKQLIDTPNSRFSKF